MRRADLGRETVLRERGFDARNKIAAIRVVVGMLQLAPAAFGKVTARRLLVVWTRRQRSIVEQGVAGNSERNVTPTRRHAVTSRRNSNDGLVHKRSSAWGIALARSSAIIGGPAASADRP